MKIRGKRSNGRSHDIFCFRVGTDSSRVASRRLRQIGDNATDTANLELKCMMQSARGVMERHDTYKCDNARIYSR